MKRARGYRRPIHGSTIKAKRVWACAACRHPHYQKPRRCDACGHGTLWYFGSQQEFKTHMTLLMMQDAGRYRNVQRQVPFHMDIMGPDGNRVRIGTWKADHVYKDVATGRTVVADTKGAKTRESELKHRIVEAVHGVKIQLM